MSGEVTYIGMGAFYGCNSLSNIEISRSVVDIGTEAFSGCSSLISIKIPSSVRSIGKLVFYNCSNLTSIEIPSSVTTMGKRVFLGCSNKLTIWGEKDSYAQSYASDYNIAFRIIGSDALIKVSFNKNGGTALSKSNMNVVSGKVYGTLPTVVKKGYMFKGWYTRKKGGTKITRKTTVTISVDHTLYAHWVKVTKPSKVTISGIKSRKSRQMKVKLKKVSGVQGYEIVYSTNRNFKAGKKADTTSLNKTVKKLKRGKTYYVKARAYKVDSANNKIYGRYGRVEKIKICK